MQTLQENDFYHTKSQNQQNHDQIKKIKSFVEELKYELDSSDSDNEFLQKEALKLPSKKEKPEKIIQTLHSLIGEINKKEDLIMLKNEKKKKLKLEQKNRAKKFCLLLNQLFKKMAKKQLQSSVAIVFEHSRQEIKKQQLKAYKLLHRVLQVIINNKKIKVFKMIKLTLSQAFQKPKKRAHKSILDERGESFIIEDSHLETDDFFEELENEYNQKVISQSMLNK